MGLGRVELPTSRLSGDRRGVRRALEGRSSVRSPSTAGSGTTNTPSKQQRMH